MAYYFSPFRKKYGKKASGCPFCSAEIKGQTIKFLDGVPIENNHYRWVINIYPKFEGHTMVVPKRHVLKIGEESIEEVSAREEIISTAAKTLQKLYPGSGVEVFLQTGSGSESSINHLHWHVVPALSDDNLRSFEKLGHYYTIEPGKEKLLVFPIKIRKAKKVLLNALAKTLGRKDGDDVKKSNPNSRRIGDKT